MCKSSRALTWKNVSINNDLKILKYCIIAIWKKSPSNKENGKCINIYSNWRV